jgi:hypothetical protein
VNIEVTLQGTTPLLMHNPQLADPFNPIVREMKALTGKRKKTDDDLAQIEKLEWHGGIYTEQQNGAVVVVQPTSKVRKCLVIAARRSKQGTLMEGAVSFQSLNVPLTYEGPREIDALWKNERYRSRLSVVVGKSRVMRCRPQFMPWGLVLQGFFLEDAGLNFEDLQRIGELAGQAVGIGDNRVNGYGRFTFTVKQR